MLALLVALVVNLGMGFTLGMGRAMESDSFYFLRIARSLAEGQGFRLREGFWPESPTMSRAPAWPFAISLTLRVFGNASPDRVMRILVLTLNSVVAVLVGVLTMRLFRKPSLSWIAMACYVLHPTALYLAYTGESEILFLVLALAGTILLLKEWRFKWLGFLCLGLSCLVRANFIPWVAFFVMLLGVGSWRKRMSPGWLLDVGGGWLNFPFLRLAICVLMFAAPAGLWMVRNYRACGRFPVLNTLRGQTFYGGNNVVVDHNRKFWGYWVFPDEIPGEIPMRELARTRSEVEVDTYYFSRGKSYVQQHWNTMPLLVVGKLVRAYVPVPWNLTAGTAVVSGYRWLMYLGTLAGLWIAWRRLDSGYEYIVLAMVCANVFTVVLMWGCARFAFELEPFLLPFAACGIGWLRGGSAVELEK